MAQTTAERATKHRAAVREQVNRIARILRVMRVSGRISDAELPSAYGGSVAALDVLTCAGDVLERVATGLGPKERK